MDAFEKIMAKFNRTNKETSKEMTTLDDVMGRISPTALASAGGVMALYKALSSLISASVNFGKQSINTYAHFESMQKGLETFFQSAEKGKETFEMLREYSNETTFGVDELANASTQLLNVGVSADKLKESLGMLGDIAGGDKQKFNDLVSIYAKVMSTGKASSMQLQQFAMRGVPIYDMLKKMGVEGQATGEQITQAFKEMTKEGGQFYGAMNNINDTITGKEGFISDYFREFLANFADASGIAEQYKKVLDIVREAIGKVSDALKVINDNPIAKAIFQGAFVTTLIISLTALSVVIGSALIGAIKRLNRELAITAMLKSVLNPTSVAIAVAVAGIAGVTASVLNLKKAWDDTAESKDKALDTRSEIEKQIEQKEKELREAQKSYNYNAQLYGEFQKKYGLTGSNASQVTLSNDLKDEQTNYIVSLRKFSKDVADIEAELKKLKNSIGQNEEPSQKVEKWVEVWNKIANQNYQGVSGKDASNIKIAELEKILSKDAYVDRVMGKDDKEVRKAELEGIINSVSKLMRDLLKSEDFEFGTDSNLLKTLEDKLKTASEELKALNKEIPSLPTTLAEIAENLKSDKKIKSGEAVSAVDTILNGTEIGTFVDDLIGDMKPMDALFKWFIRAVGNVLGSVNGIDIILNPMERILKEFEPLLKTVLLVAGRLLEGLVEFANAIMSLLDMMTGGWFTEMADTYDELITTLDESSSAIKDLTNEYYSLLSALKEQEEYYESRKKELNAQTYSRDVTKVNDMILTPNGNFSTHPNDYIIATKNPSSIGGTLQPVINNYASNDVNVNVEERDNNGIKELIVNISKKIASDFATGDNGWSRAISYQQSKSYGRSVSI